MKEKPIFVDIDTQVDFMSPQGRLYVPGAEQIVPNLRRLMQYAEQENLLVLSSADAHPPDDPSFAQWPPHCVVGSDGQKRIPETRFPSPWVIPNRPESFRELPQPLPRQIVVEKVEYDLASNPNFDALLAALGEREGEREYVLFGVAAEYCVLAAGLSLRRRGKTVRLVTDAIRGITEEGSRKAAEEMSGAGITLTTSEEMVAGKTAPITS